MGAGSRGVDPGCRGRCRIACSGGYEGWVSEVVVVVGHAYAFGVAGCVVVDEDMVAWVAWVVRRPCRPFAAAWLELVQPSSGPVPRRVCKLLCGGSGCSRLCVPVR